MHRICWQLGPSGQAMVIFFILAADAETCFSELLEPIKQHIKNQKHKQFVFGHSIFE
jgi:hypothetical protein